MQQLGFSPSDAWTALRTAAGDADAAAELLLLSGAVPSSAAEAPAGGLRSGQKGNPLDALGVQSTIQNIVR